MATVQFTPALKRFYPDLRETKVQGSSISEIVRALNKNYPGLPDYIVEENGTLRKHVNIFLNNQMINDRKTLADKVNDGDEIYIMQALSGG